MVILSILSAVLFLAAGGAGALYYTDHDKSTKAAAEQQTEIDNLHRQLEQAQADLEDLQGDYDDLEADANACTAAAETFINTEPDADLSEAELQRLISGLVLELIRACNVRVAS